MTPGIYAGEDAKALDRDVLAPAALKVLSSRLAIHRAEDVVVVGIEQLERTIASKEQQSRNLEQSARTMTLAWDPVSRLDKLEFEHLVRRRCCEIAVEAALRDRPGGAQPVDRFAWMEIVAAAYGYLQTTSRSESVHHQVCPTALEVTDSYEIRITSDRSGVAPATSAGSGRVDDVDIQGLREARVPLSLAVDGTDTSDQRYNSDTAGPVPHKDQAHENGVIPQELDNTCEPHTEHRVLICWSCSLYLGCGRRPDDKDVAITTGDALLEHVVEGALLSDEPGGPDRLHAAITLLTSTPLGLSGIWKPWHARSRQRRLLVQPVAALRDDFVVIAPHLCVGSMGVYLGYLQQGLLPWNSPEAPRPVADTLRRVRDGRNRAFGVDVAGLLEGAGYTVVAGVDESDPQRLGVPMLSGEIDVVAALRGSSVIWLIEVKDPADTYVIPEIRRHLDRFYVGSSRSPAYAIQLQKKLDDLAPYAAQVAAVLGLPDGPEHQPYEVRALFVTRLPVPAGYVNGPFPFAACPELLAYLRRSNRSPHEETPPPLLGGNQAAD